MNPIADEGEARKAHGRKAANVRWAVPGARERQAEVVRAVNRRRLLSRIDPDGLLTPEQVEPLLAAAMRDELMLMSPAGVEARRRRAQAAS